MSWKGYWGGKSSGKAGKGKTRSWNLWGTPPKKKNEKKKEKDEDKSLFPGYDSLRSSSSTQPSVEGMKSALKEAMKSTTDKESAEGGLLKAVQQIVGANAEDEEKEELRSLQKDLNIRKKLVEKMSRLKKAKVEKARAWDTYKEELRRHYDQEHEKFKKDLTGIDAEIKNTADKIEELDAEAALREKPVPSMEGIDMDAATNMELREQLARAQQEQANTAKMLALLQTQFQAYTSSGAHGPMPSEAAALPSPSDLRKRRLAQVERTGPAQPSQVPTFRIDDERERSPRRSEPPGPDSQDLDKLG